MAGSGPSLVGVVLGRGGGSCSCAFSHSLQVGSWLHELIERERCRYPQKCRDLALEGRFQSMCPVAQSPDAALPAAGR